MPGLVPIDDNDPMSRTREKIAATESDHSATNDKMGALLAHASAPGHEDHQFRNCCHCSLRKANWPEES